MTPRELPIYELEAEVVDTLRSGGRLIVQAPTGSGKSTQLPQILWRHQVVAPELEIVVLQPRRIAARMLAKRVAEEAGCALGQEVGYQIRMESRVSERTRIRFVTEGILLRQMTFDPELRGVGAILFDEFHERHLQGDISLARALQIQNASRPDLKLMVMSATLETERLREYLAPCPVLVSQGRSHPVRVEYLSKPVDFAQVPVWEVAARECARVMAESSGDGLVFMPGAYEISRTLEALRGQPGLRGLDLLPLHGELPPEAQDRAVARQDRRRIIVSTNVAETSLTIEGVTTVIDSGLARIARYDPRRGINTLLVERIAVASADQRAGRAGRTAPGVAIRLWTEREHGKRALQELPEIQRLDLAEVVLALKAAGIDRLEEFPWLEPPDPLALQRAVSLLADLAALEESDAKGGQLRITETGRRMLRFPVHPRYARMFLAAEELGEVPAMALIAALTQGRGLFQRKVATEIEAAREAAFGEEAESDFLVQMKAWQRAVAVDFSPDFCRRHGVIGTAGRQTATLYRQFLEIARQEGLSVDPTAGSRSEAVRKCVLAGFSDHVAKRLDRGTLRCELVHGRRGMLSRESAVQGATLIVAAEVSEIGGSSGDTTVLLSGVSAIEPAWLDELFPGQLREFREVAYDPASKRVMQRREMRFRDLVLEAKATDEDVPLSEAAALLAREVESGRLRLEAWDDDVEQWIVRVNRLAEWFPELEVNPIRPEDRPTLIEQVCYGELGAKGIRNKPVMPVLREWLTAEQLGALDHYLPERLTMGNGRRSRLRYLAEGPPILSARIQELYGIEGRFTLGQGRVPVRIEILAPNQRAIQITEDLGAFWREQYPRIKAELSRRYPRHEWR